MSDLMNPVETPHQNTLTLSDEKALGGLLKRMFDIVVATIMLIMLAPLMIILSVAVWWIDGAPVFFRQERVGFGERRFRVIKFRTMRRDADRILAALLRDDASARAEWERDHKLRSDPRVLGFVGAMMRKTSLDELPQLFNVLVGDMSLVGPRPVLAEELARYGAAATQYKMARPGITGLWQVSGRNLTTYDERVGLDAHYVTSWSLLSDIRIMLLTVWVMITGYGAF